MRRGKKPCPLPRAGVLVAGYAGTAQDWSLSSLTPERDPFSVSRLIPSTCNARVRGDNRWLGAPWAGGQADAI